MHHRASGRATTNTAPPQLALPELVLRVGVIGHGLLTAPQDAVTPLDGVVSDVFERIATLLCSFRNATDIYANAVPTVRVISALADGGDQLAAEAALQASRTHRDANDAKFELHCILPFEPDKYSKNTIKNKAAFDRLFESAKTVLILDGVYQADGNAADKQAPENFIPRRRRQKAYRALAWFTLQQSDIVVAIWDPNREGKPGGTEETLRQALQSNIPVIWINTFEDNAVRIISQEEEVDWANETKTTQTDWEVNLARVLRSLLLPVEPALLHESKVGGVHRWMNALLGGEEQRPTLRDWTNEFLGGAKVSPTLRQSLWTKMTSVPESSPGGAPPVASHRAEEPAFESHRERAETLSQYYAGLYRGAFLFNYLAGFFAILLAVTAALLASLPHGINRWVSLALAFTEFVTISLILVNTKQANRGAWHRKSIDYRFLAELFRTMNYLAPLGCSTPQSHVWIQYAAHNPRQTWMHWLFRSVLRQAPSVVPGFDSVREVRFDQKRVTACLERVILDWIPRQLEHHEVNANNMARIFKFIELGGRWIFFATLIFVGLHIVLDLLLICFGTHLAEKLQPWLVFLAAVLPAAVLAANGFRYQAECRRLWERSQSMAEQLKKHLESFERLAKPALAPEGCQSWDVARTTVAFAQEMVDEVADWRIVYRMHEVSQ